MIAPGTIAGLETWQSRLGELGDPGGIGDALRAEAEAIAAAAKAALDGAGTGELAASIEIVEEIEGPRHNVAVGTRLPQGWYREFGTARTRARPWLGPASRARLPSVKEALGKVLKAALKDLGRA